MAKYLDRDDVLNVIDYIRTKYISVYNRRDKCSQFWADTIRYFEKRINNLDGYDVEPVRHGHWVKEKSDVLTDTDKWIEQISNMVFDVNPAEIASHIQNGTLKEWCLRWQQEMNMLIITAPLDYSKESE